MAVKQNRQSSGIGGSLILIIFIVLTITVFSVLTLVSSQNELGTVKKSAQVSENYYAAEKEAAIKCGELNQAVSGLTDEQEITDAAIKAGADVSAANGEITISFTVTIDDNRSLQTVLNAKNGTLSIVSQKIVSTGEIIIDNSINIWDGFSTIS